MPAAGEQFENKHLFAVTLYPAEAIKLMGQCYETSPVELLPASGNRRRRLPSHVASSASALDYPTRPEYTCLLASLPAACPT